MNKPLTITVVVALIVTAVISIVSFSGSMNAPSTRNPGTISTQQRMPENTPSPQVPADVGEMPNTQQSLAAAPPSIPPQNTQPLITTTLNTNNSSLAQPLGQEVKPAPPVSKSDQHDVAAVQEDIHKKQLRIDSGNFFYKPNKIELTVGDELTITFVNSGIHTFTIDELGIDKSLLNEQETLTFTVQKAGTFRFYCTVGSHAQHGQVGELVVKEK